MPEIACTKCGVFLRPKTNGIGVLIMADFGPYQLWAADLWECPKCKVQIVSGYGDHALEHHFEGEKFERMVEWYRERSLLYEVR